jgi:hypothetical protein
VAGAGAQAAAEKAAGIISMSAFGGIPDMRCRLALMACAAIDPKRTKVGLKSRSAAVSCHRGLLSFRSEVPEAPTALRLD